MTVAFASQHTSSLPDLLQQIRASLVISTYDTGRLVLVRTHPETGLNTHFVALAKPMGVAVGEGTLAVGSGYMIHEYRNMAAVAAKLDEPDLHDAVFLPRNLHVTGDIDVHEMAYGDDEELWFVNTRMSCLCTLDRAHSVVPRWRPPFVTAYDLTDRCHLNGLAMERGRPKFVSALGATDTAGGWRERKTDGGLLMEVPSGEGLVESLSMPHSPRWYRDRLWFLESGRGNLSYYDPSDKRVRVVAELPGFTRGLDFAGPFAFIGLSQVRETNVFAGLPLTRRVSERHCGVWVVDIESGEVVAFVQFTGQVREIFAVQVIRAEYPVILDLENPLVASTYSLPKEELSSVAATDPLQLALEEAASARAAGRHQQAIDGFTQIIEREPGNFAALLSLAATYNETESWPEAYQAFERALAVQPNHAEALHGLGQALAGSGQWSKAIECYDRAIASDRTFARAHVSRGIAQCKIGRYDEGWKGLEWRRQLPGFATFWCERPEWTGEAVSDKTILVHTEPGLRDAIHFARYLPIVHRRCRRLVVQCSADASKLFEAMECVDDVWVSASPAAPDAFDLHCPINSLGFHLQTELASIPADVPYLRPPLGVRHLPTWPDGGRARVGITWRAATPADAQRGASALEAWAELFALDCDFYSLQTPLDDDETALLEASGVTALEPANLALSNPSRTAHFVEAMDLVIGVDAVATHLAGAMAKPVWFILDHTADWRWPAEGDSSPWYPTARLIRAGAGESPAGIGWIVGIVGKLHQALVEWLGDHQRGSGDRTDGRS